MSDIVERLLEQVDYLPREVRQEAAEEIKRLTMLLENSKHWEAEHLAEIERLRAGLQQITELPRVDGNDPFEVNRRGQELRLNEQARDIARHALETKP